MDRNAVNFVRGQLFWLTESMMSRTEVILRGEVAGESWNGDVVGIVNSINAEDGSGQNYNIELSSGITVFVNLGTLAVRKP